MTVELPYAEDRGQTHYEGCWAARGHHNCAVREIERLREAVGETTLSSERRRLSEDAMMAVIRRGCTCTYVRGEDEELWRRAEYRATCQLHSPDSAVLSPPNQTQQAGGR